jgi:hypothetical protein
MAPRAKAKSKSFKSKAKAKPGDKTAAPAGAEERASDAVGRQKGKAGRKKAGSAFRKSLGLDYCALIII